MPGTKPPADLQISHDLIDSLLKEFVPDLVGLPIEFLAAGWDNEIHKIGDAHAVRLPRRKQSAPLVENEQRWLPELGPKLPIPIPVPTFAGRPAFGFPWHWSVVPWIEGVPLAHAPAMVPETLIDELTGFLKVLHQPAPADAPINPYRGGPLAERFEIVDARIDALEPFFEEVELELAPIKSLWAELAGTPAWGGEPVWLHGDLHPMNILVRGARLSGVIDFGDITSGDPATDLAIAWMTIADSDLRDTFRQAASINGHSVDIHTWKRSRAWALSHATAVLESSSDNPSMHRMGATTLKNVLGR